MTYSASMHARNFALWAAARAAQRGATGATTRAFAAGFEGAGLETEFAATATAPWSAGKFDEAHERWCSDLVARFQATASREAVEKRSFSHGRVAKFLNVFLKAAYIIPNRTMHRGFIDVVHPPIDRRLLAAIPRSNLSKSEKKVLKENWTKYERDGYFAAIAILRKVNGDGEPFWKIERYWTPA
ncbi:MAG: hypothetical protein ABL864_10965 [Terricaulis sp.]